MFAERKSYGAYMLLLCVYFIFLIIVNKNIDHTSI
jgi:hypothetical protein